MIRLNCFFEVLPGHADEVLKLAKELVAASLNDKGCKGYDLFVSATRPDVMMFCETWACEECLKEHSESEHFRRLVPAIESHTKNGLKLEKFIS